MRKTYREPDQICFCYSFPKRLVARGPSRVSHQRCDRRLPGLRLKGLFTRPKWGSFRIKGSTLERPIALGRTDGNLQQIGWSNSPTPRLRGRFHKHFPADQQINYRLWFCFRLLTSLPTDGGFLSVPVRRFQGSLPTSLLP